MGVKTSFRVSCCVLTDSDDYITGVNVENASYGAGVCAERAAITRAVSQGQRKFKAIAIAADTPKPIVPCGICRQFIREFNEDIPLFLFSETADYYKVYLKDLLPLSFGPGDLGVELDLVIFSIDERNDKKSFSTLRPEPLFAVQFPALSFDHPLVNEASKSNPAPTLAKNISMNQGMQELNIQSDTSFPLSCPFHSASIMH
ncbi:hypothetical protein KGF57_001875 [Candida theae]|uniref:cytidine deaminase n=1 Tax=Candida theae TaxID=1198502 RepID=A0AAD5FZI5_9ASCO|nr:uncharacterized protein KGF57_001875 [Candida theae]KAI5960728.1 hypothetical protein KGF57_001875 [Candida theae]